MLDRDVESTIDLGEADPRVEQIYWAPGNAGAVSGKVQNVPIRTVDGPAMVDFALESGVDYTIVSQNFAIYAGVVNAFVDAGLSVYGPTREMAALEWDKIWAKDFFVQNGIPSPIHTLLTDPDEIAAHHLGGAPTHQLHQHRSLAVRRTRHLRRHEVVHVQQLGQTVQWHGGQPVRFKGPAMDHREGRDPVQLNLQV